MSEYFLNAPKITVICRWRREWNKSIFSNWKKITVSCWVLENHEIVAKWLSSVVLFIWRVSTKFFDIAAYHVDNPDLIQIHTYSYFLLFILKFVQYCTESDVVWEKKDILTHIFHLKGHICEYRKEFKRIFLSNICLDAVAISHYV